VSALCWYCISLISYSKDGDSKLLQKVFTYVQIYTVSQGKKKNYFILSYVILRYLLGFQREINVNLFIHSFIFLSKLSMDGLRKKRLVA